jgi:glyoxylase-like metal-dependent hydrolase (beta-lactamase superfamily II)
LSSGYQVKGSGFWSNQGEKDAVKVLEGLHYIEHSLADIWVGITAVQDERLLLVDSATRAAAGRTILPYLSNNGLYTPGQSVLVVNAHCHCDHIGGNATLKTELGAIIAAHEADAAFIESRKTQFESLYGPFKGYKGLAMDQEGFLELAGTDTMVDHRLVDGEMIDLGRHKFEVIHTPGHSEGSIALYERSLGILLVSDSIQGNGTTDTDVPMIVDLPAYHRSLRRLAELDVSLLVAAHPFKPHPVAIFRGSQSIQFMRESEAVASEYLDRVASLLSNIAGPVSLFDLGTWLAKELNLKRVNRYLLMLTAACLDELVTCGQARRLAGTGWQPASSFVTLL